MDALLQGPNEIGATAYVGRICDLIIVILEYVCQEIYLAFTRVCRLVGSKVKVNILSDLKVTRSMSRSRRSFPFLAVFTRFRKLLLQF